MSRRQGIFWIATIPYSNWNEPSSLPPTLSWIRGQQEIGQDGYHHWQFIVAFRQKASLRVCQTVFGRRGHYEITRSEAACDYVWKEDTRVEGSQFEFGTKPIQRNSKHDWDAIWESAKCGNLESIPASVRVQSYRTIKSITTDFAKPSALERQCSVFWGATGTGKSRRAWEEATFDAYPKDPRTKFWCGYNGEENVVIDEFRGGIDIGHVLRWLDRYPVRVEIKGGAVVLKAKKIWITSNLPPSAWYPELDEETRSALLRRLTIVEF